MIIQHNLTALYASNKRNENNHATAKTLQKLSSGYRINGAADDAAGLAISEKMRAQIRGLEKAQQNIQDGISLIQTAEGALGSIHETLIRLRELAIQAANDTLIDADRELIQQEVEQMKQGINNIANNTEFNTMKLLNRENSTTTITTPGTTETTVSTIDLSKATSITIYENTLGQVSEATFMIADLVNGVEWSEPLSAPNGERYLFKVDLTNNTFTTTALRQYTAPFNNITGVRVNGLVGYEDTTAWASDIVSYHGIPLTSLNNILGSNLDDHPSFTDTNNTDTSIKVRFESRKKTPDVTTTITNNVSPLIIHTGANEAQHLKIDLVDARTKALGIDQLNYGTRTGADAAIATIDAAVEKISAYRSKFGAYQNRLEYTHNHSTNYETNLTASESRIRDADLAKEMMSFTKQQILMQSSTAMLSQANQHPSLVLELLR